MVWWMYIIVYFVIGFITLFGVAVAEPNQLEQDSDSVGIGAFLIILWPIAWVLLFALGVAKAGIAAGKALKELDK